MVLCEKRDTPHARDGCYAWWVCFCSSYGVLVLFGTLNSFGVLLPIWIEEFESSRGKTAWIGSVANGLVFLFSPISIKLNRRYGERICGLLGSFAIAGLLIATSFTTKFLSLFITHGFLFGVFGSLELYAFFFVLKKWFKRNLGLATGISIAGGSLGTMSFSPLVQAMTDAWGWRNAFRVLSGVWFLTGLVSVFFTSNVEKEDGNGMMATKDSRNICSNVFDCSLYKSSRYTMGMFVTWMDYSGNYVAMIHMISFAKDQGIQVSKASLLFLIIGGCSTISRVIIGKINDNKWLTPMQSLQLSSFILGASLVPLTQATKFYHFIIFAVFYGTGNGAFITAENFFFLTCFGDMIKDAMGIGMASIVKSIPVMTSAPIAGFLADHFESYVPAFYMFGGLMLLSSVLPFCLLFGKREAFNIQNITSVEVRHTDNETIENPVVLDNIGKIGHVIDLAGNIEHHDVIENPGAIEKASDKEHDCTLQNPVTVENTGDGEDVGPYDCPNTIETQF